MSEVEWRRGQPAPEYLVPAAAPGGLFPAPFGPLSGCGIRVATVSPVFSIVFVRYSRNAGRRHGAVARDPFLVAGVAFLLGIPVRLSMLARTQQPASIQAFTRTSPASS